jgi:hypothetical protein
MRRPDARIVAGMTIGDFRGSAKSKARERFRAAGIRIFRMMMSSDTFAGPANEKFEL